LPNVFQNGFRFIRKAAPPEEPKSEPFFRSRSVSAIKPYEGFGDVDHTIKELMSF
jgi:hypothetical protein